MHAWGNIKGERKAKGRMQVDDFSDPWGRKRQKGEFKKERETVHANAGKTGKSEKGGGEKTKRNKIKTKTRTYGLEEGEQGGKRGGTGGKRKNNEQKMVNMSH